MPFALLDRVPVPNLRAYTAGSVVALSGCIYYVLQTMREMNYAKTSDAGVLNGTRSDERYNAAQLVTDVFMLMLKEPVCVWVMINMGFCWMLLLGRLVQTLVFGELRVSEEQHLRDKFWNFVFYKFIFVFGVINVQYIDEVLLWCSWFFLLGFLHLISQLAKDRFEYLSFSPTTPFWSHIKLLILLGVVFALSGFMLLVSIFTGFFAGFNTFLFMSVEVVLLGVRTLHVLLRYAIHLYDMKNEHSSTIEDNKKWDKQGLFVYYIELIFEIVTLVIDLVHHLHMLLWSNIFLSMASLVICMQLRFLFHEIQRKLTKHRNYLWIRNHLEQNYPMATPEELAENLDNCAICWEKMDSARKLSCSHLFHNACLLSWLEQDASCPTCRMTLNILCPTTPSLINPELQAGNGTPGRRQRNHFFHFDGSRYVSWLPSFSVEVSHAQRRNHNVASSSQFDSMARQVQQLFPHIPLTMIIENLSVTHSIELTIENILDGRLRTQPLYREHEVSSQPLSVLQTNKDLPENNWDDISTLNPEILEMEDTSNIGSRFSKSPQEREKILLKRKEYLILVARKKYIEKQKAKNNVSS